MSLIQEHSFRVGSSFPGAKREARHPPNLVPVMTPVYGVALLSPAFQRNPVSPITRSSSRCGSFHLPIGTREAEKSPGNTGEKSEKPCQTTTGYDHWILDVASALRNASAFPHYGDATQNDGDLFSVLTPIAICPYLRRLRTMLPI